MEIKAKRETTITLTLSLEEAWKLFDEVGDLPDDRGLSYENWQKLKEVVEEELRADDVTP